MKNYYTKKLVKEMNGQSFGKAIEASFHLLDSDPETTALKTQLYNMVQSGTLNKHSKKACELFSNKDVCRDPSLLKIFEDSITKSAQSYGEASKSGHVSPLAYADEDVSKSMNQSAINMHGLCESVYKNHTRSKNPSAEEEESFKQQFRYLEKNWTLYLYDKSIRTRLGLESLIGPDGEMCPGYKTEKTPYFATIAAADIQSVKKTYREATKKQIKTTEEIQAPRRTNLTDAKVSDIAGAYICDMSIDEKIDAYALKKLTNGHPYTTGQVIGSVDESQKLAYLSVICSAKKCESNIDSFNQPIKDFADTAAQVGLVALTIVNPPVGLAASITYKTGKYTQKHLDAKSELDSFNASLATNGFNAAKYDEKLSEKYDKLNKDALAEKLVLNLTVMLAKTAIASGAAEKFLHTKVGEAFLKKILATTANAKPSTIAAKIYQELSKKAAHHSESVKHELHHAVHGALEKSILHLDAAL